MKAKDKATEPKERVYEHSSGVTLIAYREFPDNPRFITQAEALKLAETMGQFGSLDGVVVNVAPGKYQGAVVSGNQKTRHIGLEEMQPVITKRFKTATEAGTTAYGYIEYKGERFPFRTVYWSENKCEVANIVANNAGGHNDPKLLANFSEDIRLSGGVNLSLEQARYRLLQNFLEIEPGEAGGHEEIEEPDLDEGEVAAEFQNYQNQNIRQIVLFYKGDTYEKVVEMFTEMGERHDIQDNSTLVLKLIGLA